MPTLLPTLHSTPLPTPRARLETLEPRQLLAGQPDVTFADVGTLAATYRANSDGIDLLTQPDKKIVVVGDTDAGANKDLLLARFLPSGTADLTFGNAGSLILDLDSAQQDDLPTSVQYLPDGRLFVSGTTGNTSLGNSDFFAAMFTAAGALDTSFAGTGWRRIDFGGLDSSSASLYDPAAGRLYLAGTSFSQTSSGIALAALNLDGSFVPSFGNAGITRTQPGLGMFEGALDIDRAGQNLIIAGFSAAASATANSRMLSALFDTSGTLVPTFGTAGRATTTFSRPIELATSVAVDPASGRIYLAGLAADGAVELAPGTFTGPLGAGATTSDFAIAALTPTGTPDLTFASTGQTTLSGNSGLAAPADIALQSDGALLLTGGLQNTSTGQSNFFTSRLRHDGQLDTTFATAGRSNIDLGASDGAFGMHLAPDGSLHITGHSKGAGTSRLIIIKLTSNGLRVLPSLLIDSPTLTQTSALDDLRFTVALSHFSDTPVTVNADTLENTALANEDYLPTEAALTFAPGELIKTFEVPLLANEEPLDSAELFARLADPVNALLARSLGTGTILQPDLPNLFGLSLPALAKLPPTVVVGTSTPKGTVAARITNTSLAPVKGVTTATVYASPTDMLNTSTNLVLGRATLKPNLKPTRFLNSKVNITIPRTAAPGTMTLFLVLTGTGVVSQAPLAIQIPGSVRFQPPAVSLKGPTAPVAAITARHFKKFTATLPLTNTGNIPAAGPAEFEISLVGNGRTFTYFTKTLKLNIKPARTASLKFALTAPPATPTGNFGALPAGSYTLRIKLLTSTLAGTTNDTNGQVLATAPFELTA